MRLLHLSARGVHGRLDLEADLDPVSMVIGPNGSGKSSLVGLPRLVLNGPAGPNWPVLGTSPRYDWEAVAQFDSALTVARWVRSGTHAASFRGVGGSLASVASKVAGTLGRAATWNLEGELLDLTPAKRQAFLEVEVLRGAGWAPAHAWEELEAKGAPRSALEEVLTAGVADPPDGRVLLTSVLAALRIAADAANTDALRLGNVVKQDAIDEGVAQAGLPSGTVVLWRDRAKALNDEIANAQGRRGVVEGKKSARDELALALERAQTALARHLEQDWAGDVERARAVLGTARAGVESATSSGATARTTLDTSVAALGTAQSAFDTAQLNAAEARAKVPKRTIPGEILTAEVQWTEPRPVVVVDRETGHIRSGTMHRTDRVIVFDGQGTRFNPDRDALFDVGSLTALAGVVETALTEAKAPVLDLSPLTAAATLLEQEREAARTALDDAKKARDDAQTAFNTSKSTFRTAQAEVEKAESSLRTAETSFGAAGDKEAQLRADVERISSEVGVSLDGQVEAIDGEIAALQGERDQAEKNADALSDVAGAGARRLENRSGLTAAQAKRTRARELAGLVEEMIGKMLGELTAPLEEPVSRITRRVLGADFRVELDGGATFWLAWPGRTAPLAASRSEQAVTMMALRCAVQQSLGGWRHLVLDDMENLGAERRTLFLEAMAAEVVEGRLDNFLGACVEDGWKPPAGVQAVHRSLS